MVQKPETITNWSTYFVALYLAKEYEKCLSVFDSLMEMVRMADEKDKKLMKPTEICELYFLKAMIYEDMGDSK